MKAKNILLGMLLVLMVLLAVSCNNETPTCTLSYDANGGFGTPVNQTGQKGSVLTVSEGESLTYKGHSFVGWNTTKDGKGTAHEPGSTIQMTGDVKLYAQWVEIFTISFLPNGAEGEPVTQTVEKGTRVTVPDGSGLVFEHYEFDSWNTVSDGTGTKYYPGQQVVVNSTVNLFARWRNCVYTISFNANGGSGSVPDVSGFYGNTVDIPDGGFSRQHYVFTGWNTSTDGSGDEISPGPYTVDGDRELYAQWLPESS